MTATSRALTLKRGVFKVRSAGSIAPALRRSAGASHQRQSSPFRSAMSMLTFYLNRGRRGLSRERRQLFERAKPALRRLFGRTTR